MERADISQIDISEPLTHALFHFVCGTVRKSRAQNIARSDARFVDEVAVARRQRSRFARTRSRDDAHAPFRLHDGCLLFVVER